MAGVAGWTLLDFPLRLEKLVPNEGRHPFSEVQAVQLTMLEEGQF